MAFCIPELNGTIEEKGENCRASSTPKSLCLVGLTPFNCGPLGIPLGRRGAEFCITSCLVPFSFRGTAPFDGYCSGITFG